MRTLVSGLPFLASSPRSSSNVDEQGNEVGKDYLRRLRTAVFSMEGSASQIQRLRDKVMSEMVVPRYAIVCCVLTRAGWRLDTGGGGWGRGTAPDEGGDRNLLHCDWSIVVPGRPRGLEDVPLYWRCRVVAVGSGGAVILDGPRHRFDLDQSPSVLLMEPWLMPIPPGMAVPPPPRATATVTQGLRDEVVRRAPVIGGDDLKGGSGLGGKGGCLLVHE